MVTSPQTFKGEQIGLPRSGPGSLAATGPRLAAFVVDVLGSALIAALFVSTRHATTAADRLPGSWSLIPLALDYVVGVLVAGRSAGMYLFGLRLIRVQQPVAIGPVRIVARTALLFLLVPALVFDRDGRGMHDRLCDTAVVRAS